MKRSTPFDGLVASLDARETLQCGGLEWTRKLRVGARAITRPSVDRPEAVQDPAAIDAPEADETPPLTARAPDPGIRGIRMPSIRAPVDTPLTGCRPCR